MSIAQTGAVFCMSIADEYNAVTSNTHSISDNKIASMTSHTGSGGTGFQAAFTGMTATGYDLNFTNVFPCTRYWWGFAVETDAVAAPSSILQQGLPPSATAGGSLVDGWLRQSTAI